MSNELVKSESTIEVSESVIITFVEKVVEQIRGVKVFKKKKPIRVTNVENKKKIDLSLEVNYGIIIPEVIKKLQKEIIETIKTMTGIDIIKVDVTIDGLNIASILEK